MSAHLASLKFTAGQIRVHKGGLLYSPIAARAGASINPIVVAYVAPDFPCWLCPPVPDWLRTSSGDPSRKGVGNSSACPLSGAPGFGLYNFAYSAGEGSSCKPSLGVSGSRSAIADGIDGIGNVAGKSCSSMPRFMSGPPAGGGSRCLGEPELELEDEDESDCGDWGDCIVEARRGRGGRAPT